MFRWNLMLRKLFGSLPQQSKARRPKATVKPHVEDLTPRILPSASPLPVVAVASPPAVPSVAAITSYVSSMMELRSQLIATIEQDLSNALNTVGQEIYSVERQWGSLMGINPSTPNASLNATVTQPDSGMGRGNSSGVGRGSGGLAATQNTQNQTLNNSAQQTGHSSGSGSNATTASDADAPPHRLMKAQPLTSPGSGSITGDTYQWDPGVGYSEWGLGSGGGGYVSTHIYTPKNLLAGNPVNWLKNGNVQSVPLGQSPTVPGNKPGDTAVLGYGSAATGQEPIEWNGNFTFSTLSLENGYTAQETIDAGDTLELTGVVNSTSFTMDDTSVSNVHLGANSKQITDGDAWAGSFNWTGAASSLFLIQRGTTMMAEKEVGKPPYSESLGAPLTVGSGGILNYQGNNTLNLTANYAIITVNGEMDAFWGPGSGINLIQQSTGVSGCYIDVKGGTLKYVGSVGVEDTIAVPILVEGNGTFNVTSKGGGGWLIVTGQNAQTMKYSVYMTSGSVNLSQASTLECVDDYRQDAGTLQTTDSSNCALQDGATGTLGTAVINGGSLIVNGGASSGVFNVEATTLNFNGAFKVGIQGNQSGQNGQLKVTGNMNIQGNAVLTVSLNGNLNNGNWTIIDTGGNNIALFPANNNPPGLTQKPNTPQNGDYQVTSP